MSDLTPFVVSALMSPAPPCDPDEFLVHEENFNYLGSAGVDTNYWQEVNVIAGNYTPNTAQEVYPLASGLSLTPPSGNTRVANYAYKESAASGNVPWRVWRNGVITELYATWSVYYSNGFIWPEGQKLFRIGNSSEDKPSINFEMRSFDDNVNQSIAVTGSDENEILFGDFLTPLSGFLADETWHDFAVYFRQSSAPDVADGRVLLWVNGTAIDRDNVVTNLNPDFPFNYFFVTGNNDWNGSGPGLYTDVPQDQNTYIDNIRVFSSLPCNIILP